MSKYTKEQIDSMTPEQLKRAIATDVMGLSIYHYDKDYEANCYFMLVDENFEVVSNDYFNPRNGECKTEEEAWKDCPDFLNDPVLALKVFEKFGFQGSIGYSGGDWFCDIMNGWDDNGAHYGISKDCKSIQEAIYTAALLAVME